MISVVVPVYNIKQYIEGCVDSLLKQTYQDLEIILVDDGSTDESGAICDEIASRESRVRVVHKVNGGLSSARNAGLEAATGDYVCFLDGDDVFHQSMLKTMVTAVESGDYDFSMVYSVAVSKEDTLKYLERPENPSPHFFEVDQSTYMRLLYDYGTNFVLNPFVVANNKLFKRSFLSDLRFKKTVVEDVEFNNRMCQRMRKAIVVEEELYYWIQRETSLSHAKQYKFQLAHFNLYEECIEAIPEDRTEFRKICLNAMFKHILSRRYALRGTDSYDEALALAAVSYERHKQEYFNSGVNLLTKLVIKWFYHFPKTYVWFRALCDFLFVKLKVNDLQWFLTKLLKRIRNKKLSVSQTSGE